MADWGRLGRVACICVLFPLVGFATAEGAQASAANVRLVDIEIEVVPNPDTDRGEAALDMAVVGDAITLLPVVELTISDVVDPFEVEIYYVEKNTGRSGRIGSGWVPGLSGAGSISRPAVTWRIDDQAPGHYDLIVRGPFEDALVDEQGEPETISIKILKSGLFLELFPAEGNDTLMDLNACPMGGSIEAMSAVNAQVVNLGTETASNSNVAMQLEYRIRGEAPFTIYENTQSTISVRGIAPGAVGTANLTLLGGFQPSQFEGISELGTANDIQFRLSILDSDNRLVSPLVVDTPRQYLTFYSSADAWTYPARPGCEGDGQSSIARTQIAMKLLEGLVYHISTLPDGTSVLGGNTVSNGAVRFVDWSPEAIDGVNPQFVGLEVVRADATDAVTVFITAKVVTATGIEGYVYAIEGREETIEPGSPLRWFVGHQLWRAGPTIATSSSESTALGSLLGNPVAFAGSSGNVVVVGSEQGGLFALQGATGNLRWHVRGAMTQAPIACSTDEGVSIWYATGSTVSAYLDQGMAVEPLRIRFIDAGSPVTTPLVPSAEATRVFFGTANSIVFSERVTRTGGFTIQEEVISEDSVGISEIKGLTVVNGDENVLFDVVVYATTSRDVFRLRYDSGRLVKEGSLMTAGLPSSALPSSQSLGAAVGVLLSDAAAETFTVDAVFVVSQLGELRAYSDDFADVSLIQLWGAEYVEFAFDSAEEGLLSTPIVYYGDTEVLLTQSRADGLLYAFSLRSFSPR